VGNCGAPTDGGTSSVQSCSGVCANTTNDPLNCGGCGRACPAGDLCVAGACAVTCAAPATRCGNGCPNTSTDPNNCGGCDVRCQTGQTCTGGVCG
jgi:hypothetical protein